jgi:transposase-like protein
MRSGRIGPTRSSSSNQAGAEGKDLVGPGGLLSELTKQVLETGLEVEMVEHLGDVKHAVEPRSYGNTRTGSVRSR